MKKRISQKEWESLSKYNYAAKWLRPLCSYFLVKEDERFKREQYIPLGLYFILFIPVHLLQALLCMWDGGLKEFEIAGRYLGGDYPGWIGNPTWEKAKGIWEKHK